MNQPQAVFDFDAIEMAFYYANFDGGSNEAYLDRHTGEALYFSTFGDSDEEPDDIDDTSRYVALPDARDMGLGSRLAVEFASDTAPHLVDDVRNAFGTRTDCAYSLVRRKRRSLHYHRSPGRRITIRSTGALKRPFPQWLQKVTPFHKGAALLSEKLGYLTRLRWRFSVAPSLGG